MGMRTNESFLMARSGEPRTRTALLLESIALRHQIAVLERSRTRRPCFRLWDRLFWILFSRWWPQWRDSLVIVQPETVLRWRRDGWSALWRYRARGRWRGRRPRISSEVRQPSESRRALGNLADDFAPAGHIDCEHLMGVHVGEEQFTVAPSRPFGKRKSVD
jgi:hypothetical protein